MRLGRIVLVQLSYTPLLILLPSAMGGDAFITCCACAVQREWLQQLRLMSIG